MTESARMRLLKYLPVLLTACIGLVASAVVFFVFRSLESTRLRADFQNMAADRAQALRSAIGEDQLELALIADYVSASTEISRGDMGPFVQEFGRLGRRISQHEEDVQVIAFVSSVTLPERAGFEALMRKYVDAGYAVREAGPSGALREAGARSQYFPITVMEPEQYSGNILGLDIATIPRLHEAVLHAVSSGKSTASAAVDLPLSASGPLVVWSFRAVQRAARISDLPTSRTGLLGICATAFRIDQMVELAMEPLSPAGIDIELRDADAPGHPVLYYRQSREPGDAASAVVKTGMRWSTSIDAGQRTWLFTASPTSGFISQHRSSQSWFILAGALLLTGLTGFMLWGRVRRTQEVEGLVTDRTQELAQEISKHETLEQALAESRSALTAQVAQLNERNQLIQLLNEVGDSLQSCLTAAEAYATVSLHGPRLLPGTSGILFSWDPAKDLYSPAAEWGGRPPINTPFRAQDCWALRRGKPHAVTESGANLPCPHTEGGSERRALCIPLSAIGKTIGLLSITACDESMHAFAESVAEHIALALSNLMLRSDLRQLSIHDPLTGLYNRRFMEETLETEIRRAERKDHPIGIIMLDIDHFKTFNDGFGHAAGDQMLRSIGGLILSHLRAGDIACRYGGEELLLILPEATAEAAAERAEDLRVRAKKLEVRHQETPLGPVTVSLGVSVYPANGRTRDALLAAADASLYRAKQEGRDRVVVAEGAGS
jgi:diguanylate cyclase (GGDEF)-like protein